METADRVVRVADAVTVDRATEGGERLDDPRSPAQDDTGSERYQQCESPQRTHESREAERRGDEQPVGRPDQRDDEDSKAESDEQSEARPVRDRAQEQPDRADRTEGDVQVRLYVVAVVDRDPARGEQQRGERYGVTAQHLDPRPERQDQP